MSDWPSFFMAMAKLVRTRVKGPDLGVGCVLVSPDKRGLSIGYSGFPRGFREPAERITDTAEKDKYYVHAELNAILNASGSVAGWTMYCTTFPCSRCAAAIIQAGITKVVAPDPFDKDNESPRWLDSHKAAIAAFGEAEIEVIFMEIPQ